MDVWRHAREREEVSRVKAMLYIYVYGLHSIVVGYILYLGDKT